MYYFIFIIGCTLLFIKESKITFTLYLIALFLLSIFRFGVGPDYFSYQYLYGNLNTNIVAEITNGINHQEVLFRIIGSFLKDIGFNYQQYLIVFSFINLYFIVKMCKEFSEKPSWSLFLYYSMFYFVWTFSGLRQGLTLAIGCYSYLRSKKNNTPIRFIIIIFILSLIHSSALILLVFYLLTKIKWSRSQLTLLTFISILISVLPLGPLLNIISNISFLSGIKNYISVDYSLNSIFDIQSLARIGFLVIGLFYYNKYISIKKVNLEVINLFIIGLNIYFILKSSELLASRLSIYGYCMIIIILPSIYNFYKIQINRTVFKIIIILFCFLYMTKELAAMKSSSDLVTSTEWYVPYTSLFNKFDDYYFESNHLDLNEIN